MAVHMSSDVITTLPKPFSFPVIIYTERDSSLVISCMMTAT